MVSGVLRGFAASWRPATHGEAAGGLNVGLLHDVDRNDVGMCSAHGCGNVAICAVMHRKLVHVCFRMSCTGYGLVSSFGAGGHWTRGNSPLRFHLCGRSCLRVGVVPLSHSYVTSIKCHASHSSCPWLVGHRNQFQYMYLPLQVKH